MEAEDLADLTEALSYEWMRPSATSVCGLKLLVYEAGDQQGAQLAASGALMRIQASSSS